MVESEVMAMLGGLGLLLFHRRQTWWARRETDCRFSKRLILRLKAQPFPSPTNYVNPRPPRQVKCLWMLGFHSQLASQGRRFRSTNENRNQRRSLRALRPLRPLEAVKIGNIGNNRNIWNIQIHLDILFPPLTPDRPGSGDRYRKCNQWEELLLKERRERSEKGEEERKEKHHRPSLSRFLPFLWISLWTSLLAISLIFIPFHSIFLLVWALTWIFLSN